MSNLKVCLWFSFESTAAERCGMNSDLLNSRRLMSLRSFSRSLLQSMSYQVGSIVVSTCSDSVTRKV